MFFSSQTFESGDFDAKNLISTPTSVQQSSSTYQNYKYNFSNGRRPWKTPIPPLSSADLIRQDQLRLVLFILHLAQIWTGGFVGAFFGKKKGAAHDRHAADVYQSRLARDPKQGTMSTIEETEDMASDWSFCVKKYSSLKDSTEFEAGFEEGVRESVENGESQLFRQGLQQLFELLALGNSITKQRMEKLFLCLRGETATGNLDSFEDLKITNNNNKKENNNTIHHQADVKIKFPKWPPTGISSKTDLGLYITLAAEVLGYQRRQLCDELSTLLLQSAETSFGHSVFVPSEGLRSEFHYRSASLNNVFNKYAAVSRKTVSSSSVAEQQQQQREKEKLLESSSSSKRGGAGASSFNNSPARSTNNRSSSPQRNSNSSTNRGGAGKNTATKEGEPTLVFSKKSYFKWLEDEVSRHYPDSCPSSTSQDAESLYQHSLNYAPERDRVLLEMLICATAAFVDPNPFTELEVKVKTFCDALFG